MAEPHLTIRFQGAGADQHRVDLRQLGHSLLGIERIVTHGLFALEAGRFPKKREPLPLLLHAEAPQRGCVEVYIWLVAGGVFLPVIHDIFISMASDVVWRWINGVLLRMAGRDKDADAHLEKVIDFLDKVDARRHLEVVQLQKLATASKQVVTPVGQSCNSIVFPQGGEDAEIDLPLAEAIRSMGKVKVGDMKKMRVKVDGFTHHNKQLKIIHPDEPGCFVTAYVQDPAFAEAPNVYTEAATNESWLKVTAKPTTKDGRIHALYIMDAQAVEGDPDDNAA